MKVLVCGGRHVARGGLWNGTSETKHCHQHNVLFCAIVKMMSGTFPWILYPVL